MGPDREQLQLKFIRMDFGFGDLSKLGDQMENMLKKASKHLTPKQRAELNKAQQSVKGLFRSQDLNNIANVDVSKLQDVQNSLTKTLENLKDGLSNNQ